MSLGPIMLDIEGTRLTTGDRKKLQHPLVGGVILFTRNYSSFSQLVQLTTEIHALRSPPLLIAVDHEGGRVQRFREGFTRLPPMRELGRIWDEHPNRARDLARQTGYVLAAELRAAGVDLSFTPVLDMDHGQSCIIGDRAFHHSVQGIADLAHNLMSGLKLGGMAAVGKHFPGHGYIQADSHIEMPVDERPYPDISKKDLLPFSKMIDFGLAGIMPAHIIYPRVDARPAGFSEVWLKQILRGELGFEGCIFSDDLNMEGASVGGNVVQRAKSALNAGCDMALLCNNPEAADMLLAELRWDISAVSVARLARMRGRPHPDSVIQLHENATFVKAVENIGGIGIRSGELPLR
ncbi:beta-N-acetylhexosaminidase [Nitrosospira sp. Nl5]|uniref:beta-N-acetylhexosaminidase n=1 Tax=Nitrosospira sp. Nl5 TaxID=200120 RepID=UPI00088C9C3B|nr:beta-N-acetylhexosaminidase [Nitrosospira sp. Nl5]SCX89204.1 beta-N-acetylhexosaminidase [Nitrosospira sp. Nl5]